MKWDEKGNYPPARSDQEMTNRGGRNKVTTMVETGQAAKKRQQDTQRDRIYATDWRSAVNQRLAWLESLICMRRTAPTHAAANPPPPIGVAEADLPCGVAEALDTAREAIKARRGRRDRVRSWWTGWDAENAWHAVHIAEVELVSRSADLANRLPGISEQVAKELPPTDRRLKALESIDADQLAVDRASMQRAQAVVREAMGAAFDTSENMLRRVRILRNQMLLFGGVLLLLNVLIGILASAKDGWVPLCVDKGPCPTGNGPTGGDVWTVQLFGVLGAVVAVVVLLVNSGPQLVTYTLTGYQSFVKITLGATLAMLGVLAVAAGVSQSVVSSQAALLFTALLFGYAQQLATQFLDNTANRLVSKAKTGSEMG